MDVDTALAITDKAVFEKKKIHLTDVQRLVFKGSWSGESYPQMVEGSGYALTYLKQDIGPKLWRLISEVFGEPVSKNNLKAPVEREQLRQRIQEGEQKAALPPQSQQLPVPGLKLPPTIQPPPTRNQNFIGRENEIAKLNNLIEQGAKIILIHGKGGVGKSLLSWEYITSQGFDLVLELWMAKEAEKITSAKSVVEEWLRRYFQEDPRGDFGVTLEQLRQNLRDQNRKVAVLVDNLETALDKNGKLIDAQRDYVELFRVLADPAGNSVTLMTSREKLGESAVTFQEFRLEGLELFAWKQFFKSRNINYSPALSAMHRAYGGNTKAMHILSGVIKADWSGDIEDYWLANERNLLIETDLQDLVVSQFERLEDLDPDAYKLLCRLGCYRYQDVRAVNIDTLMCLLWDVSESQRRKVVNSLRDRSLVDSLKGEYWLHPVIRAEARTRLKSSDDWRTANQKAAEFWTESIKTVNTTEDALRALEAYYHYIDIGEFELACDVLLQERQTNLNSQGEAEALIVAFGRFGLVQHILTLSTFIYQKISHQYYLVKIYFQLGLLYQLIGDIQKAIQFYEKSRNMIIENQNSQTESQLDERIKQELNRYDISILFTISSCKEALWEIKAAIESYEQVAGLAENTYWNLFAILSWLNIAYLYSNSEVESERQKSLLLLEKADLAKRQLPEDKLANWSNIYSYFIFGMTYTNLGQQETALLMFNTALSHAENSNYVQGIGRVLTGLAVLSRQQQNYHRALENHQKSVKILEGILAKKDLADAHYEMGLTYQKIGEIEKSKVSFQAAIRLYEQMGAPQQVKKVERAIAHASEVRIT